MLSLFKKDILFKKTMPVGIDIGDTTVRVVQLEASGGEYTIASLGRATLPKGSIIDGVILKEKEVTETIQNALKEAKPHAIKAKKAVISLFENKSFLRIIDMPSMPAKEREEAIGWKVEENIPLAIEDVYYDYHVLPKTWKEKKGRDSVMISAASKDIVEKLVSATERAGLQVIAVEIESLAQGQGIEIAEDESTKLILDIGGKRTNMIFMVHGIIVFTSSIAVTLESITEAIAKEFQVSGNEAKNISIETGISPEKEGNAVQKAIEPVLADLLSQIETSIQFFTEDFDYSTRLDEIILCGGGARIPGIDTLLGKSLNVPVKKCRLFGISKIEKKKVIAPEALFGYSTAVGVALFGAKKIYENIS